MKELKVYVPQDGPYGLEPEEGGEPVEEETCYLKSDVDAVIAELKKEKEYVIENTAKVINAQEREIRHQKYKRCLGKAEMCGVACDKWMMKKAKAIGLGKDGVKEYHQARRKLFHYMRWQTRWIKIAEKFKEEK